MKIRIRQWMVVVAGVVATLAVLVGVKAGQIVTMVRAGESFTLPPEAVTSAPVEAAEWEQKTTAVGSLVAARGVVLAAESPGTVREIGFESGSSVRQGAVLVKLDTSAEEAQLAAALAEASLARLGHGRAAALRLGEANTQVDLDTADARLKQADATVANLRAIIARKVIRAPFDGRVAIRQVELGQFVSPGSPIASLQSVSPVYADFSLPQQELARAQDRQRVRLTTDTYPGRPLEVHPDHDQPGAGPRHTQRALAGHLRQPRPPAAARHVRARGGAAATRSSRC